MGAGNDTANLLGGGSDGGGGGHDTFTIGARSTFIMGDAGNDELVLDFDAETRAEWDRFDGGAGRRDRLTILLEDDDLALVDLSAALAELEAFDGGPRHFAFLDLSVENVEIVELRLNGALHEIFA